LLGAWRRGQRPLRLALHVIEDAGHFMVVERPEAFLEARWAVLGNR
jgi:pimeloyl-ACP methyl ester carboxylesterase